jgi:predicted transcriptional regulator
MAATARRGRPVKPPLPGTKSALGLRVSPEIKGRLDEAAGVAGRTQSQEAELRIETSFRLEDQLDQALALLASGEEQIVPLLRAIGTVMAAVGSIAATYSAVPKSERFRQGYWFDDPYAASKAIEAAHRVLDLFTPDAAAVAGAEPQLLEEPAASLALAMLETLPNDKAQGAVERMLYRPPMLDPMVRERVLHHLGHVREQARAVDQADATVSDNQVATDRDVSTATGEGAEG